MDIFKAVIMNAFKYHALSCASCTTNNLLHSQQICKRMAHTRETVRKSCEYVSNGTSTYFLAFKTVAGQLSLIISFNSHFFISFVINVIDPSLYTCIETWLTYEIHTTIQHSHGDFDAVPSSSVVSFAANSSLTAKALSPSHLCPCHRTF